MSLVPILSGIHQPDAVGLPTRSIQNQDGVNCCFSCALASAMEASDPAMPELAPLFHFHFAGGQRAVIDGLTTAEAQAALLDNGICAFERHPVVISEPNVSLQPSEEALADGFARRPLDLSTGTLFWKPVTMAAPEQIWKRYLAAGHPIVIGLQPNDDYLGLNATRAVLGTNAGPYRMPGHAAVVIGYSDAEASFIVQDSRNGTAFGIEGQWFFPYDLVSSPFVVVAIALVPDDFD